MKSKRSSRSDLFVIWIAERRLKQKEIEKFVDFDINAISEIPSAYLASNKDTDNSVDVTRQRLHEIFGPEARIFNVLKDEEGHILIPTGNISAVLTNKLSKQRLDDWAKTKQLRVISQSKWRPQAVVLSTEKDEPSELNKALEALQKDPQVEVVEQEVFTKFHREGD
jgi:hypothetical protein